MTEDQKERLRKIRKLFAFSVLKRTLWYVGFLLFTIFIGVVLLYNAWLDVSAFKFYLLVSTWISWLGCWTDNAELYDIMIKDTQVVLTTQEKGTESDEK